MKKSNKNVVKKYQAKKSLEDCEYKKGKVNGREYS